MIGSPGPGAEVEDARARAEFEWMRLRDPRTGEIPRSIRRDEYLYARTLPTRGGQALLKGSAAPGVEWIARGPSNIGGRTRALAIDLDHPNVLVAGGITGGMWRSTDRGSTWNRTTLKGQMPSVTCIVQDPRSGHRNVWYHGTGEGRTNSTRFGNVGLLGDGIYRSIDSARSWEPLLSTVTNTPQTLDGVFDLVWDIAIDPTAGGPGIIYAAAAGRVMRSSDGGANWSVAVGDGTNTLAFTAVTVTPTGVVYAAVAGGSQKGIWRSPNGTDWTNITPPTWPDSMRRIVLAVAPSNGNILYVFSETPGSGTIISGSYGFDEYYSLWKYRYASGDGTSNGGEWSDRSGNIPLLGNAWNYNGLNSYAMLLKVHPLDTNIVYLGGTNLYRSDDGFATEGNVVWKGGYGRYGNWGDVGELHPDQHALVFDPNSPSTLLSGSDGGLAEGVDGPRDSIYWTSLNNNYVTTQFYTVAIDQETSGSPLLLGGLQDNGTPIVTVDDPNVPWELIYGGDGSFCAVADSGRTIYVSSQGGNVRRIRSSAPGDYSDYALITPQSSSGYLFIAPFVLDPSDRRTMYFPAGIALWRNSNLDDIPSENPGRTSINWRTIHQTTSNRSISAIGVSTRSPQSRVYYGTTDGVVYRIDNARGTQPSAREVTGLNFPSGAYVNCIAVDPNNGDNALVVFTNYGIQSLYHTGDGGLSWTAVGGNLEENPDGSGRGPSCRWAAIGLHDGKRYIFVGTTVGLFSTTELDGGNTTWMLEGDESIGYVRVDMITMRKSDGAVAVATWGNGMYTTTLPTSEIVRDVEERFVTDARPNPTAGRTIISFTLNAPASTELFIYDTRGALIDRMPVEYLDAGRHDIEYDASALPTGLYYYSIRSGEKRSAGKFVVRR